jgi:replication factor C large subunit
MASKEQTWVEKYRPNYFSEVKGQEVAVYKIKQFIENFAFKKGETINVQMLLKSRGKNPKRAMILYGPPGTGKTTLAHVAARETDSEIFELNASDLRDKERLKTILRPALEQKSLTKENKIILVDEVDGISKLDYGGLPELLILAEASIYPIIITANDIWDRKFNVLRNKSEMVQLKEVDYKTIKDVLINILKKENLFIQNEILTKLAEKAKGDLRAAINDLQAISKSKDHHGLILDDRNKEIDIFNALRLVFKGKAEEETIRIFDSVKMPIDDIILWVEENIPSEYSGEELYKAYERLSKVDVFRGRIYKQQYWRFLVYENFLLSFGIAAAKKEIKTGFTSYKKPGRILKIWLNNQIIAKKKTITQKYAHYSHIGEKRALSEFPVLKYILKNPSVQKELRLTEEEIEYLKDKVIINYA